MTEKQFLSILRTELHTIKDELIQTIDERINALRAELKQDMDERINALRSEFKQDMDNLRTELKQDMGGLRAELKQDMNNLRTELRQDMDERSVSLKSELLQTTRGEMSALRHDLILSFRSELQPVKEELRDVKNDVRDLKLCTENEIRPQIQLLAENYIPAAKRYERSTPEVTELRQDVEIMKHVLAEHSGILKQLQSS